MGVSSAYKLCLVVLLFVALCYGKDQQRNGRENTLDVKNTTDEGVTPVSEHENTLDAKNTTEEGIKNVLQHGYGDDDNSAPRSVVIVTPIFTLLVIGCCVYFCCRCRSQRNMGVVVHNHQPAPHPPPPAPAPVSQTIIFQQQPNQPPPPVQQMPYPQQYVPPPALHPQQHVPPPYDTQPYPQQQYHAQAPTAYANPNYAPQPPNNTQYGQEKY